MDRLLSETLYEPGTIALQTNIQQKCALKLSRQACTISKARHNLTSFIGLFRRMQLLARHSDLSC